MRTVCHWNNLAIFLRNKQRTLDSDFTCWVRFEISFDWKYISWQMQLLFSLHSSKWHGIKNEFWDLICPGLLQNCAIILSENLSSGDRRHLNDTRCQARRNRHDIWIVLFWYLFFFSRNYVLMGSLFWVWQSMTECNVMEHVRHRLQCETESKAFSHEDVRHSVTACLFRKTKLPRFFPRPTYRLLIH